MTKEVKQLHTVKFIAKPSGTSQPFEISINVFCVKSKLMKEAIIKLFDTCQDTGFAFKVVS